MAKKKTNKEVKADSFESAVLEIKFVDDEPKAKEPVEEEVKAQAVEIVEELPVEDEEVVEEPKEEEKVEEAPPIPVKPPKFYHVDQFLQTAIPLFGLNAMQARGFKAKMQGKQYQEDMNIFVNELKKYLNIQ